MLVKDRTIFIIGKHRTIFRSTIDPVFILFSITVKMFFDKSLLFSNVFPHISYLVNISTVAIIRLFYLMHSNHLRLSIRLQTKTSTTTNIYFHIVPTLTLFVCQYPTRQTCYKLLQCLVDRAQIGQDNMRKAANNLSLPQAINFCRQTMPLFDLYTVTLGCFFFIEVVHQLLLLFFSLLSLIKLL